MKRKLAAIVLAIAMVFTMMPMTSFNYAYADEAVITFNLTDTDLEWDPVDGAAFYQIDILGQWMQDEDGGPDYTECSFPRQKIDKYIINHVLNGYCEETDTSEITVEAAAEDGGLVGVGTFEYPSPVDDEIDNVKVDEYGNLTWDDYYPGTYYVYANDTRITSVYDDCYVDLNGELEYKIQTGILKKASDDSYTIRIDNVVNRDDGEAVVASAELVYTYVTATENPYFENIGWDEGGEYIVWDNAPCAEYIDAYIDGVKIDSFSSWTHIPTLIDKLVRSGKLDNSITDHEIILQAKSYAEGMYHTIYEWSTEYQYLSTEEVLTAFPEDMGIDENGYIQWSYFKDVEYFGYYINDFHNENFISESLYLNDQIDDLIESETITKSENDSYYFKLEALDKDGNVLDTYEENYIYHSNAQLPSDEFYCIEVREENGGTLYWNKIRSAEYYDVLINGVLVSESNYSNYLSGIKSRIDDLIRNGEIEKASDNIYIIRIIAKWGAWEQSGDEEEYVTHELEGTCPYYYETIAEPAKDTFESVELCMDEDSNYYRQLVWNDIKGAERYEVEYSGEIESCYGNSFDFCSRIDNMIENGEIDNAGSYEVTITAYDYDGVALATCTRTIYYQSSAGVPFKININDGILTWQGTENGSYIRIMANDVWISEMISVDAESVNIEALIDQAIIDNVIDKKDSYDIEATLYNDEEDSIDWYSYYDFEYSSDAVPDPLPEIDVIFDGDTGEVSWGWAEGHDFYRLYISEKLYTNCYESGYFELKEIIDEMILRGDIDKPETGDYPITVIAYDDNNKKVGRWEGTLHYESDAEPIPDVNINANIDENGVLRWEDLDTESRYIVYASGDDGESHEIYTGVYPEEGIDLQEKVDKLVREISGFKTEEDYYWINITAFSNVAEDIPCGHWGGSFEYASPYEYLPPAFIETDFDYDSGWLTWDEPEDAAVDHYVIYIENYNIRITEFTGRNVNVYEALTAQGFDGEWLNIYVIGEDAEGIRVARSDSIEGSYRKPVAELTEDDAYIDSDGYLVAKPYEGADYYRFVLYYTDSEGYESQTSWEYDYIDEIQSLDVNDCIDRTIKGNKEFKNTGIFDVGFQAIKEDYGLLAERRWSYEYDTDAEYIPPVEMQLNVANGWITSDYTGADHYELSIEIEDETWRYQYAGEDELNFFLAGWINVLIDSEDIDAGSKHNIEVNAYKDGVLAAYGELPDYLCKVTEIPALSGIAYDEETGVLSWNEVEKAEWYSLMINGFRAVEIYPDEDCRVDICRLIDSMIRNEEITKADSYRIEISAMNQGFHIADGTYNLVYDSPAEPPVEFGLSFENGILSWEPVDGAYEYQIFINDRYDNNRNSFYVEDNTSVEIDEILDMCYTAETITEDSEHIISVLAYNTQNDPIGKGSGNYTYAPKEYIPQELTGIVCDEYGDVTWDKPDGATGYTYYINGQDIDYYAYSEEASIYDIKRVIDRQIRREVIEVSEEDRYEVTIKAYTLHDTSMVIAVGSIVIDYDSPATPPVLMTASINNGILSWEAIDGAVDYNVWISNRGGEYRAGTLDTQIDLEKLADLIYTYERISADSNLEIEITAYNNYYDPLGKWEGTYKYTPKEYTVQEIK